jgi:hypothetical protein
MCSNCAHYCPPAAPLDDVRLGTCAAPVPEWVYEQLGGADCYRLLLEDYSEECPTFAPLPEGMRLGRQHAAERAQDLALMVGDDLTGSLHAEVGVVRAAKSYRCPAIPVDKDDETLVEAEARDLANRRMRDGLASKCHSVTDDLSSAALRERLGWAPLTDEQRAEQLERNLEDLGVI